MLEERMKAALLHGVKDLRVENVNVPEAGPGEILAKVKVATTCGTDVKIFQRGYIDGVIKYPTIFGHEWAGKIVKVDDGIHWLKKGMRIRAGNSSPCLRCIMCQRGNYNLCENMTWLWGAYAEYIKVPARIVALNTQRIPANLTYAEAAITEPLACVLHGIEKVNIKLGDTIAIMGAGPIGLLHLQTSKKLGGEKLIVSDHIDERLHVAQELGADEIVNPNHEDPVKRIRELTNGVGADVVIEAVGLPTTWEQALRIARRGGTVLEFGGCPPGTVMRIGTELLHYGEVTIRGTFHATPIHFRKALNLIASGAIEVKPLITKNIELDQIKQGFETLSTSKEELKMAIHP